MDRSMEAMRTDVIGVLELASIAAGVEVLDAMVKAAPVVVLDTRTITPGKYLILVTGEVAEVEAALEAGRRTGEGYLIDELFIPRLDPRVIPAIRGQAELAAWDALGVVESFSVTASIEAADVAVKEAAVQLPEVRLAAGMGGKSYIKVVGLVEDVVAAVEAAAGSVRRKGLLCNEVVIPLLHPDIRARVLEERFEGAERWK